MKRFILLLPMLYSLAIGAEVEFTPAEEKAAQIIAVDHDPDPYQFPSYSVRKSTKL